MRQLLVILLWVWVCPASAEPEHFYVPGAGEVPLAVTAIGPKDGPEILLLHGLGHGRESFRFQLNSDLAETYRVVAFDLRGHGQSGKPWTSEAYGDPAIWAEDVMNVMAATGLKRPIVVGWSYGGLVAADMVRDTGRDRLSGLVLVSSLAGLVTYTPDFSQGGAEMAKAYKLLGSPSFDNQARAIAIIGPFLVGRNPTDPWPATVAQLGLMLPPYVRPLLAAHRVQNQDLLPRLQMPLLVMHGETDPAIPQSAVDALVAAVPKAKALRFDSLGHSPFAEAPELFNAQLSAFVDENWRPAP